MTRGYRNSPYLALRPGGRGDVSASHVVWRAPGGGSYAASLVALRGAALSDQRRRRADVRRREDGRARVADAPRRRVLRVAGRGRRQDLFRSARRARRSSSRRGGCPRSWPGTISASGSSRRPPSRTGRFSCAATRGCLRSASRGPARSSRSATWRLVGMPAWHPSPGWSDHHHRPGCDLSVSSFPRGGVIAHAAGWASTPESTAVGNHSCSSVSRSPT